MNCDEALLAISAALDGELSPRERLKLSDHLLQCDTCRELAEDLRVLTEKLGQSDREVPPELAAKIRRAVAEEVQAAPAPKRRRAPYLRAVAAMLALCVCLGGAGLFVSGQRTKSNADAGEAAPFSLQAAPKNSEGTANRSIEDDGTYNAGNDPEAPAEAALTPSPEEIPLPMPSIDPDSDAETSDEYQETAPSSAGGGEDKVMITPEEALELVFEHLGGYETYPEARQCVVNMYGFDAPAYYLKTVENDAGIYVYCLDYIGLSGNEQYYQFRFYEDVTDKKPDGFDHTATSNHFIVSQDGFEILSEYPPDGGDDETWAAYFDAYNSALAR